MFWRTRRIETSKRTRNSKSDRKLLFEGLEMRAVFANDVTVALAGTTLTITGDVNPNQVEITPGATATEFKITGLNGTTIIGPAIINDPFDKLVVKLGVGSDTFTIRGTSATNKLQFAGDVLIENSTGNDVNTIENALISDDLTVTKTADGEGRLTINQSTIVGDTALVAGAFNGASKTIIQGNSSLQGNLDITNNVGEDHLVIFTGTVDGNATIANGDGDTITTLGESEDPVIFGKLSITNGLGNDKVFIHNTDVWDAATVTNGDGHTLVSVETSKIGLGAPVGDTGDMTISNGIGFDEVTWTNSTVRDDLMIDNGASEVFGSKLTISGSNIGDDLTFEGDYGRDQVSISTSTIVDNVDFKFFDGSSETTLLNAILGSIFSLDGDAGNDLVMMDGSTIQGDVTVDLGAGTDVLEVLNGTKLQGSTSFMGGAGIDTFKRQVAPTTKAIVIAFLAFEDLENDTFATT